MNRLPVTRSLAWVTGGFALLRRQGYRLLLIGLIFQFLAGFTQAGPLGLLFLMAVPALTAGVLQAMQLVSAGHVPPVITLFVAFREPARLLRLFMLGLFMLMMAFLLAGGLLSGSLEALDPALLSRLEQGDVTALQEANPEIIRELGFALIAALLVSALLGYFSIPLVWFAGMPLGKALVQGLAGILANLFPFILLAAVLFLLAMPVGLLVSILLGNGGGSMLSTLLMLLTLILYQLLVFGTQFCAYRDVFGLPEQPASRNMDQLVA